MCVCVCVSVCVSVCGCTGECVWVIVQAMFMQGTNLLCNFILKFASFNFLRNKKKKDLRAYIMRASSQLLLKNNDHESRGKLFKLLLLLRKVGKIV